MKISKLSVLLIVFGINAVAVLALAQTAQQTASTSGSAAPEMQLPPGWTAEDMQAMMEAATPGEIHAEMAKDIGTWECETTMWMTPESEPAKSVGEMETTGLMDGRYLQCEMKGEMPGMGPYHGLGIYGYDKVTKKFVGTWLDNFSTGIMMGEGELSADGKKLSWTYKASCPIAKKQIVMREIETETGPNTRTIEMFGPDPETGKEYKTMEIKMTKK
jgi:hypothetical protein